MVQYTYEVGNAMHRDRIVADPCGKSQSSKKEEGSLRPPSCATLVGTGSDLSAAPDAAEIRGPAERLVKAGFRAAAGEQAAQRIGRVREILLCYANSRNSLALVDAGAVSHSLTVM